MIGVIFIAYINGHMGGLWSPPCVCAAFEQTSRHEMSILIFRTGNLLIDTLAFMKAAMLTLYTGIFCLSLKSQSMFGLGHEVVVV